MRAVRPRRAMRTAAIVGLVAAMAAAACTGTDDAPRRAAAAGGRPTTPTPLATTTTTTAVAPATTTTTIVPLPPVELSPGAEGPDVVTLQQRLTALRYDPGEVDGRYGAGTVHAVTALQKVRGLPPTGRATADVLAALADHAPPPPLLPDGGPDRVEIDLTRQVLFLYQGGALSRVLAVSTGNGKRFCSEGRCRRAVTPGGSYRVERRVRGWRRSALGLLYNPLYFNRGIAIHGAPSVPPRPASHGCVRIPMHSAQWFPSAVPDGTPVYVVGGSRPAVAFPSTTLPEPAPAPTTEATAD